MAPPAFERAVAYGPYREGMRLAIHALKYGKMLPAARQLGQRLAAAISQLDGEAPLEMLVVPVPLHRSKLGQRGFNQADALALHALESLRKTHPHWQLPLAHGALVRKRATGCQAGLTTRQRRQNVRGAFSVTNREAVHERHVLLIDDIYTTGATARAAAQALRRAGAASVWVATLSRAYCVTRARSGSTVLFEDTDDHLNTIGIAPIPTPGHFSQAAPGRVLSRKSIHSSHDQPSF